MIESEPISNSELMMICFGAGGVKVVSRLDLFGVVIKSAKVNLMLGVGCKNLIHERFSGMKGGLQKVEFFSVRGVKVA